MTNMDKLYEAVEARGPVCVGLDTDFSYLPEDFVDSTLSRGENIVRFNKKLIDATKAVAGCYKVQIAYYDALALLFGVGQVGADGVQTHIGCQRDEIALEIAGKVTHGVHPSETAELTEESYSWLKEQCQKEKCLAVGEIGLDYYWPEPDHETQKKWFLRQLDLAREIKKPVIIHSRDAAKDTVDLMMEAHAEEIGGVIHCYSYTKETAKVFLDMGFYFGIGGVLTFKNAKKLKEAVEYIPMDRIVLETDCPYLAPEPNRGKRNSSLNIPYVIAAMAQIKGITEEEVRKAAWDNSLKLYRMDK